MPSRKPSKPKTETPKPHEVVLILNHARTLSERCTQCGARLLEQALPYNGLVSIKYCGHCAENVSTSLAPELNPMLTEPKRQPRKRKTTLQ